MEDLNIGLNAGLVGCLCKSPCLCMHCANEMIMLLEPEATFVSCPCCREECDSIKRLGDNEPTKITSISMRQSELDALADSTPSEVIRTSVLARRRSVPVSYEREERQRLEEALKKSRLEEAAKYIAENSYLDRDERVRIWVEANGDSVEEVDGMDNDTKAALLANARGLAKTLTRQRLDSPCRLHSQSSSSSGEESLPQQPVLSPCASEAEAKRQQSLKPSDKKKGKRPINEVEKQPAPPKPSKPSKPPKPSKPKKAATTKAGACSANDSNGYNPCNDEVVPFEREDLFSDYSDDESPQQFEKRLKESRSSSE